MQEQGKRHRLWKFVKDTPIDDWKKADISLIDDISSSWFEWRKVLEKDSHEYKNFIAELKREHAIETGIVERLYDLKRGITETFIKEGFFQSLVSHNDTNISVPQLFGHLKDHLEAVDFVFDVINENRPLTVGFVKELHALVTRNQNSAEGRDLFGRKLKIELLRGTFKVRENNPTREDGTVVMYCPPEHVDAEMDSLISIYNRLITEDIHPVIIAAWFHHAFTTIHPFQDGNGRVARLLASLILIKFKFFPFTVLRGEVRLKYFKALEDADNGVVQPLVNYFSEVQKRNIEKALNLKEDVGHSLDQIADILTKKIEVQKQKRQIEKTQKLEKNRMLVFDICLSYLTTEQKVLSEKLGNQIVITIKDCSPANDEKQHFYFGQIVSYARQHGYYFNHSLPKAWITFRVQLSKERIYQLGITIHHYGYGGATLAIGAFLEFLGKEDRVEQRIDASIPLDIKPHVISIVYTDIQAKEKNINSFLNNALALTLAQIANEL